LTLLSKQWRHPPPAVEVRSILSVIPGKRQSRATGDLIIITALPSIATRTPLLLFEFESEFLAFRTPRAEFVDDGLL
jgi:hypothetical protein